MQGDPLYLYGVVRADARLSLGTYRGVGGGSVHVVEEGALGAVVTKLPAATYEARRADLVAHSDVLQSIVESTDVLPMGFGTVFVSSTELARTFLRPNHDTLAGMLDALHDLVEIQVRAEYEPDATAREIATSDRSIQKLQARVRSRGDVESKIELGRRFASVLEQRRYSDGRTIVDRLAPVARDLSVGDARGEYALLQASFLVPRSDLAAFDAAADAAATSLGGRASVRSIGPLPPYSFVDASALAVA